MKTLLSACALSLFACTASANWIGGISYTHLSVSQDGISVDQPGVSASLGYRIPLAKEGLSVIPEIRVGQSMGSSTVPFRGGQIKARLEGLTAISVRVQYQPDGKKVYYFVAPAYGHITYRTDHTLPPLPLTPPITDSENNDIREMGISAGLGYFTYDNLAAELVYEHLDKIGVLSVNLKYYF